MLSVTVAVAIGYAHFAGGTRAARDIATHLLFIHTWPYDTLSILYRAHAMQCCTNDWMELLVFNLPGYLEVFAAGMISALLYLPLIALLLRDLWSARFQPQWSRTRS